MHAYGSTRQPAKAADFNANANHFHKHRQQPFVLGLKARSDAGAPLGANSRAMRDQFPFASAPSGA
jgi:hypothetical protein